MRNERMKYDFNKPQFGRNGITFPEKKSIDGYSLIEDLARECQKARLQFIRLHMQINDSEGHKLAVLRNCGTRLEFTDFVNERKGWLNTTKDVHIFVMELF